MMDQQISDEEIQGFLSSQRKAKRAGVLANSIRKHFGDRALDSNGGIQEAFWSRLYEINASRAGIYESQYQRLLFQIILVAILLLAGIRLAIYLWITR